MFTNILVYFPFPLLVSNWTNYYDLWQFYAFLIMVRPYIHSRSSATPICREFYIISRNHKRVEKLLKRQHSSCSKRREGFFAQMKTIFPFNNFLEVFLCLCVNIFFSLLLFGEKISQVNTRRIKSIQAH